MMNGNIKRLCSLLFHALRKILGHKYSLIAMFVVLHLLIYGYSYWSNAYISQDLPFIHKIMDPSLYPSDVYVDTLESFPTMYLPLMAMLGQIFSLSALHLILYLVFRYIFFLVVYECALLLFSDRRIAFMAVFLTALSPLANLYGLFGEEPLFKPFLYHGSFTIALTLLSLYLFLRQKFLMAFSLLGFVFYFNGMQASHMTILFFFGSLAMLTQKDDGLRLKQKKELGWGWMLFVLLIIPFLWHIIERVSQDQTTSNFIVFLRHWYPGHCFPSLWGLGKWIRCLTYLSLFFLFTSWDLENKRMERVIRFFLYAVFTMWIFGAVFSETIPTREFVVWQLFRSDIFVIFLGLLFVARAIQRLFNSGRTNQILIACVLILLMINFNFFFSPFLSISAFLLLAFFRIKAICPSQISSRWTLVRHYFWVGVILSMTLFLPQHFSYQIMTYPFYLMILILILFGGSRPDNRPAFLGREKVRLFLIVIMLIPFTNVIQYRLETRMLNFQTAIDYNWHELQLWVKDHTPKHSVFLVPPYVNGFRAFSKRSTIIERLDGTASHWRKGFEKIWTERLQDLGYEGTFPRIGFDGMREDDPSTVRARSIYASINDEKIRHLQKKYTIDFVVVEDYHHLPFPVVFQNDDFKIYQVTDS